MDQWNRIEPRNKLTHLWSINLWQRKQKYTMGKRGFSAREGWEVGQFSSVTKSCLTLWDPMDYSTPGFPVIIKSWSLLKLMSIESIMPSNHLILFCPLLLPSTFPSITVFSNESVLHIRWPKYCSFSFIVSSSNEYSGLISFTIDWFDLLAV